MDEVVVENDEAEFLSELRERRRDFIARLGDKVVRLRGCDDKMPESSSSSVCRRFCNVNLDRALRSVGLKL